MRQSRDEQKLLIVVGSTPLEKESREQVSAGTWRQRQRG